MWPFGKNTAQRVEEALQGNPVLAPLGLVVQEKGGTVTVTGEVARQSQVGLISAVAGGISGVRSVDTSGVTVTEAQSAPVPEMPSEPVQMPDIVQQSAGPATASTPAPTSATPDLSDKLTEDNSRVAKAVLAALRGNGELADDPIDVLQSGKSVILRGVVDSDHEKRLAEQLARDVDGVAGVDSSGLRVAAGVKELAKEKDEQTGDTVYTVKPGDSLSAIAQKYYGDAMEYKKIAHYNNISNPDLIQPGQRLRIPG
ncbi:BON domain-containing protein [Deinococcus sp. Leaf326]|jgi:nucleoid-associated protein YgaU|uniref:BON domain-containing protein n=1 Tax=Deinococcus sp. Leaf326 TaxID=1736338 RepID=UPI0006F7933E|nr:BON domain-containing protein [Deinococcus sp. Leaf326]KQR04459.1 hypothetical protein ASF71_10405 [Deinococcus sp. Leaf326]